ncbi:MAG TPA: DUF2214 family protein [Casimicrobiaceae bacterium]
MMASLFAFLHFLAAFTLFAALAAEIVLTRGAPDLTTARRLLHVDAVFGIAATLVLVAGVLRVLYFERGPAYYVHSAPFIAKMLLFALVGLLSIYPTRRFLSWRPALARGVAPVADAACMRRIRRVIHVEATLVVLLILCASLMAHGVGMLR